MRPGSSFRRRSRPIAATLVLRGRARGDPRRSRARQAGTGPGAQPSPSGHSVGDRGQPAPADHVRSAARFGASARLGTDTKPRDVVTAIHLASPPSAHALGTAGTRRAAGRGVPAAHPTRGPDTSDTPAGPRALPEDPQGRDRASTTPPGDPSPLETADRLTAALIAARETGRGPRGGRMIHRRFSTPVVRPSI